MFSKIKKDLVTLVTAAAIGISGAPACIPTTQINNVIEHRETTVQNDLEDIAKSIFCIRTDADYEPKKEYQSHGTAFAYMYKDGYTYLFTNSHNVSPPEQSAAISFEKGPEGIKLKFQLYKKKSQKVNIVDNKFDSNKEDDLRLEIFNNNKELDVAILRTKQKLPVSTAYLRNDQIKPRLGEDIHIIGYPKGLFKTHTKGSVAKQQLKHKQEEYQVLDITSTFGNSGSPYFLKRNSDLYLGGVVTAIIPYTESNATLLTLGVPLKKFSHLLYDVKKKP